MKAYYNPEADTASGGGSITFKRKYMVLILKSQVGLSDF